MINLAKKEWNDDLVGFVCTLNNKKTIQVQFEKQTNRLHADYNQYYPILDLINDYDLNLTIEEEEQVELLISQDSDFLEKAEELSKQQKRGIII